MAQAEIKLGNNSYIVDIPDFSDPKKAIKKLEKMLRKGTVFNISTDEAFLLKSHNNCSHIHVIKTQFGNKKDN